MSHALALIIHRFARHTRVNGVLCLTSNGDPALMQAFAELGWSDPHPIVAPVDDASFEAATLEAPERAVLEEPEGHLG